jgi:hypothetical protein
MSVPTQSSYELILETFRAEGIRIIHRNLKKAAGLYYAKTDTVTIGNKYKNTLEGCYYLCHEIHHRKQARYNEFKDFFNMPSEKLEFNEDLFETILEAEMDAVRGASVLLKTFGVKFVPPELTEKGFEYAKNFWKSYYFKTEGTK